jgi:hypothetical protein
VRPPSASGKTIIQRSDVHCHLNQPADVMRRLLPVTLNWGVTTVRMTGNDKPEIMHVYAEARQGKFPSPRVYSAGQGFNLTGPYPGAPTLKPTTPEEARKGIQAHKALNVDFIKIWMSDKGGFTPEVVAALVDEAKKQGIPVVAHINSAAQVRQLADMGVRDFLHEARDGMNPEFIAYAKSKGLSFAPTLGQGESRWFYYEHPELLSMDPKFDGFYARGRAMLNDPTRKQGIVGAPDFAESKKRFKDNNYPFIKRMSDAGVRIVTGTDCGAEASQTTPVGLTTHRESAMFVEPACPHPLLRAATLDAAGARTEGRSRLWLDSRGKNRGSRPAERRSAGGHQQHHQNRSRHESGNMGAITIRPDIHEKHRSLFGDKTVNGRRVNVEDLIAQLTRETKDEFRTLLSARHAFQEQVGRRERSYGFLQPDTRISDADGNTVTVRDIRQDARYVLRPQDTPGLAVESHGADSTRHDDARPRRHRPRHRSRDGDGSAQHRRRVVDVGLGGRRR